MSLFSSRRGAKTGCEIVSKSIYVVRTNLTLPGPFWIDASDLRDAVLTWLRDPVCRIGLQDMPREKRWVNSLFAQDSASIRLLENVAIVIARLWFESQIGDNLRAVEWLVAYHDEVLCSGTASSVH